MMGHFSKAPLFVALALLLRSSVAFTQHPALAFCRSSMASNSRLFLSATATKASTLEAEALSQFFTPEQLDAIDIKPATGGVSNRMSYIDVPNGDGEKTRYLLRIYNNGKNSPLVEFEHEIMKQLNERENMLSFQVPCALPLLADNQKTHTLLSSGDEACVFELISGSLPKLNAVTEIGRASGELHTALGQLDIKLPSQTPPYYKIFEVHHAINREKFYEQIASPAFDSARADIDRLVQHVRDLEGRLESFHAKNLPEQLIHGDLHYDNVLYDPENQQVTGLLDFEYCGFDWRAMELAICLSKYAGEPDPLKYFEEFVRGFAQTAQLTEDEIDSVPDLIVLRILSNVVFFVGRTITGEDDAEQLTSRAGMYSARIEWLLDNRETITKLIEREMAKTS